MQRRRSSRWSRHASQSQRRVRAAYMRTFLLCACPVDNNGGWRALHGCKCCHHRRKAAAHPTSATPCTPAISMAGTWPGTRQLCVCVRCAGLSAQQGGCNHARARGSERGAAHNGVRPTHPLVWLQDGQSTVPAVGVSNGGASRKPPAPLPTARLPLQRPHRQQHELHSCDRGRHTDTMGDGGEIGRIH